MLAKSIADASAVKGLTASQPLWASPKLDGIRCIAAYDRAKHTPRFFSRRGLLLECCDSLVADFQRLFFTDPCLVLDGELYCPDVPFQTLSAACRTRKSSLFSASHNSTLQKLQFHAFDVMHSSLLPLEYGGTSARAPYDARLRVLAALPLLDYDASAPSRNPPGVYRVANKQIVLREVRAEHDAAVAHGFEGLMLRRANCGYAFGRRSAALLKVKRMLDTEYRIVGVVEGHGRLARHLGSFTCVTKSGLKFNAAPKCTQTVKRSLWSKRETFLDRMLTVQYQNLSPVGVPRFPIAKGVRGEADESDWL
jgi:DNA ligase-1